MRTLLTRDDFREAVFKRDGYHCLFCEETQGLDAHHIIERRLFSDGGYYIDNGVTLCQKHHLLAESTELSCDAIRTMAGIIDVVLPEDFYDDCSYDKWGNIHIGKLRTKGPLFFDENVQKIIKGDFTDYVKYPRTYHLPWTGCITKDDRVLKNVDHFIGREVVVTEKLDGENSNLYTDYFHARSLDGNDHWTQNWLKSFHAGFGYEIPKGWRVCGENLYAKHSIKYVDLKTYFFCFSIWNDKNICLSWDDTIEWCSLLGVEHVPVIYRGIFDEETIKSIQIDTGTKEGYVVRVCDSFAYGEFSKSIAKFVRRNHVQDTVHNWRRGKIDKNELEIKQ
jgi:hypothetical protein